MYLAAGMGRRGARAKGDGAVAVEEEVVRNGGTDGAGVEVDSRFSCGGCAGDGVESVAGYDPTDTALAVDGGGGGAREGAVGDGSLVGAGLNGDGVGRCVGELEVGD